MSSCLFCSFYTHPHVHTGPPTIIRTDSNHASIINMNQHHQSHQEDSKDSLIVQQQVQHQQDLMDHHQQQQEMQQDDEVCDYVGTYNICTYLYFI